MKKAHILLALALVFALLGAIFTGIGFNKITEYENSEWGTTKNVYVGGDAYNYIINGTYFAGYSALGGAMFICACLCAVQGSKEKSDEEFAPPQ